MWTMTTPSLTVQLHERRPGFFEMALAGRLDTLTCPFLEDRLAILRARMVHGLHLEMGQLEYISSMGLRAVVMAMKQVREGGGSFSMSGLQPQVKKVFDIVSLLPKESVFASVAEADRYFDAMQRKELEKLRTS